jgi:hypothetical protein
VEFLHVEKLIEEGIESPEQPCQLCRAYGIKRGSIYDLGMCKNHARYSLVLGGVSQLARPYD